MARELSRTLAVAFCVALTASIVTAASCPSSHVLNPVTNTCFRVVTQGMNWHQAKSLCEASGETLAVIDTKAAFDWLRSYSSNKAWRSQALWIAGKATGSYWRWYGRITSTLSTSNSVWYPSHPYNSRSNFCVAFYAGYNGIIQRECSTIYTYYPMCERPPTSCPPNYVRSPITNTCLGVTQQGMNWHQAKAHCEEKGQKLAVLDTKAAFDWLKTYSNGKAWSSQALWIAGRGTGSSWRWYGRITSTLSTTNSVWYPSHPYSSNSNSCVAFYAGYNGIIQRACSTIYTYYPLCEV